MRKINLPSFEDLGFPWKSSLILLVVGISASMLEGIGISLLLPLFALLESESRDVPQSDYGGTPEQVMSYLRDVGFPLTTENMILTVAGIVIVRQIMGYFFASFRARLHLYAEYHVRTSLFDSMMRAHYAKYLDALDGSILSAINFEARRATGYVISFLGNILVTFKLIVYVGISFFVSWQASLVGGLVLGGIGLMLTSGILKSTRMESRHLTHANESFSKYVSERLKLIKFVKLAGMEKTEGSRFADHAHRLFSANYRLRELSFRIDAFSEPVVILVLLGFVYFTVVILKTPFASIGVLVVVLVRLLPIMKEMLTGIQAVRANYSSILNLEKIKSRLGGEVENLESGQRFPRELKDGVHFESVSFIYPRAQNRAERPALFSINLHFEAGKTTALLGPSGAGKSTLIDLIPRLFEPNEGSIRFDSVPSTEFSLGSLRKSVGIVSQNVIMMGASIADNIAYGSDNVSRVEIVEAAKMAHAHDFVSAMPDAYDTILGEFTTSLSGGEQQRLAIARALIMRPTTLILDEPTSALDSESEEIIRTTLKQLQRDQKTTIIIIAHRLSTVRHANQTIVLRDGRVLGQGTHDELIANAPWYRKIVELQTGEHVGDIAPNTDS